MLTNAWLHFSAAGATQKNGAKRQPLAATLKDIINMIKKIIKWTGIIAISASVLIGLFFLNRHIKNEKLLFYSSGTNKKAILNSTWNMSYKEVERVNEGKLKDGISLACIENGLKNLLNTNRFNTKTVESMNLWS